ncbi:hypothetical protein WMY93_021842 [Mugilogobius chulae]|uniref:Macrophage mannose receptor 1-like n=1 Tax=Mugilogobius chulae TaxID=88201 RepID=A0AAW0NGS6_9GOBI
MSIQDIHERLWLRTQIGTEIYWIGLTDQITEGVWEWTDGTTYYEYLSYWMSGQPDNWNDEDCGQTVGYSNGRWNDEDCSVPRKYICKYIEENPVPRCDQAGGWSSYGSNCYKLKAETKKSWADARRDCVQDGADLVSIASQEEEQYIVSTLDPSYTDLWIGLSTLKCNKISCQVQAGNTQFAWSDALALSFQNWGENEPSPDPQTGSCAAIIKDPSEEFGKWRSHVCRYERPYMCKRALNTICPSGWQSFNGSCYWFVSNINLLTTWHEAYTKCSDMGAHLLIINSQEEQYFINSRLPDFHHVDIPDIWIGLSDMYKDGEFKWVDKGGFDFSNFQTGFPKNTEHFWDCGQIYTGNYEGKWETANCFKSLGYVDFLPWAPNQPDNWQNNEDCVHIRGMNHHEPGKLNDDFCTDAKEFICKKAKGQGPPPQPPTSGPGWNDKCGSWTADPFNDYCYLFNFLSLRTWAEARADCMNQGGDLVSITDPFEQSFIQGFVQQSPTGISLWMGGHDSITEGGWEWTDGSPFRYIRWNAGNPDDYLGEDCLSILINNGYWNDDNCEYKRGYICKKKGKTPEPPPPHDGFLTALVCQDSSAVLHCPQESVINIQSAFFGRKSDDICPHVGSSGGSCTVEGILPFYRKNCDNRPYCFAYAHVDEDPCPPFSNTWRLCTAVNRKCAYMVLVNRVFKLDSSKSWRNKKVTGIVIQGCPQDDHWITKFKLQHSVDGTTWKDYTADGTFFPGSSDRNTPDTQLLGSPVSAQYIRILPMEFNGKAGLRFDVLGCKPDYAVTCANKPNFNFANDRMTVHCPAACAKTTYQVYGTSVYRGDSNICAAAIHAGVIVDDIGGDCTLLKAPGQSFYPGSTRNGITSREYSGNYAVSYTFADGDVRCPGLDWYEFGEFCYKPSRDKKTWHAAQDSCRKVGAELVSILSMKEQSWLESYLYLETSDVWTGLNDFLYTGFFTWSDKHEVTFTYWAPGEPNNHDGFSEDCVEMLQATGRWNDVSCTELNTYICKMPKAHYPLPSARPTVYGCPQGWNAYGYSCYWMEETARSWDDAKAFCKEQDSFLVHIGDIYEQSHFTVMLSGKTGFWWMGLRARGGTTGGIDYIWDNGAPLTFTHWDRNQPDSGDGTCVAMTSGQIGGFWDDKQCTEKFAFICEKARPDITPPTKAPTPPPSQGCVTGWTALPHFRNCYKLFHKVEWYQKKSWEAAYEDCVSRGANLVSIHNQEEEEFLSTYTKGTSKWIGLKSNPTEGANNHDGREDCVEMVSSTNGTYSWWNDLNCDAHQDWICMIAKGKTPILPPQPPSPAPAPDCGTNPGWRKNNNICYYYNDTDAVDFHTAMMRCYAEKATLVSILSRDEQAYVNTMVGTGNVAAAWIGLRMFGIADGQYMWVDFSPLTYTHWGPGEPNNANGEEQCVQMNRHQGGWNDANCGRMAGYVCKKLPGDHHTPPPPTQPWEGNCPAGWLRFNNKCFLLKGKKNEIKANWTYARTWCKQQGAELAVIDSQYENDFVTSYLRDLELPTWIGLSDLLLENQYAWSDGEHCVAMITASMVKVTMMPSQNKFVCSKEMYHSTSSSIEPPPPTRSPCPSGYISWYQNCYKLVEEAATEATTDSCTWKWKVLDGFCTLWTRLFLRLQWEAGYSWADSRHFCQGGHAELASLHTRAEVEFIRNLNYTKEHNIWIGLTRDQNFGWAWTDKSAVGFFNWAPGEPNFAFHPGQVAEENCVEMYPDGRWNDNNCLEKRGFACRHPQFTMFEETKPELVPDLTELGGVIAGAIIGAIIFVCLIGGILYYAINIRGFKLSNISLPTKATTTEKVDVPAFANPNFSGESDI